jgi:hypothetical protein
MKIISSYIISFLLLIPLTSHSALDGNLLLRGCSAAVSMSDSKNFDDNTMEAGYCLGLVQGISGLVDERYETCPPSNVPNMQLARVVAKYLRENPKELHQHTSLLVVLALGDAWPCPDSSSK